MIQLPTISPKQIFDILDSKVIGQTEAKRSIANTLFLHYVNLQYKKTFGVEKAPQNANTLIMGPSGNGKTFLITEGIKAIRQLTGQSIMPMLLVDCTNLGAGGTWAGLSLIDHIAEHVAECQNTGDDPESTVVYLDEVDKLCDNGSSPGGIDLNKQIQYTMLKALEGAPIKAPRGQNFVKEINTANMLFVLSGNFPQVRKKTDEDKKVSIGFVDTSGAKDNKKDLVRLLQEIGMATQFAGRLGKVLSISSLTKRELCDIALMLMVPEIVKMYDFMGYTLHIPLSVVESFAEEALANKTGARGLQSAFNKYLEDTLFDQVYVMPEAGQLSLVKPTSNLRKLPIKFLPVEPKEEPENDSKYLSIDEINQLFNEEDLDPNAPDDEYLTDEEREEYIKSLEEEEDNDDK